MAKAATKASTKAKAEKTPEVSGPARYRARVYHEIETETGVMRVEPGQIVVTDGDVIEVFPPENFVLAYPSLTDEAIDDQPDDEPEAEG